MSMKIEGQSGLHGHETGQDGELVNGNLLFSKESTENAPVKEARVIKKARRYIRTSPRKSESDDNESVPLLNGAQLGAQLALQKNSRKSRNGHGRGLPKKGEFCCSVVKHCLQS